MTLNVSAPDRGRSRGGAIVSRRNALSAIGLGLAGFVLAACGGAGERRTSLVPSPTPNGAAGAAPDHPDEVGAGVLDSLPRHKGHKVIYAAANRLGARAGRESITFKQTPYALEV